MIRIYPASEVPKIVRKYVSIDEEVFLQARDFFHRNKDIRHHKVVVYDEMVSRYEAAKAERDALAGEIRQRGIRRREFERFITTLESLSDQVTDFSDDLWGSLVEYLTVYAKDDLRFMLPCGVEIAV